MFHISRLNQCFQLCLWHSTHYAGYQGAVAARNVLLPFTDPGVLMDDVPATTFVQPEISSVGLSESDAKATYGESSIEISSMKVENIDRAICDDQTAGQLASNA